MGHGCACQIKELERRGFNVNSTMLPTNFTLPAENWEWRPDSCALQAFNATLFCSLLGTKKLLMVGDSTMQQTAASLYSVLLHQEAPQSCLSRIIFELSDYVVYHPDESRGQHFVYWCKAHQPDILVLGSSAHYDRAVKGRLNAVHSAEFMDFFVPKLVKDIEYLRLWPQFCPKRVLFKTQNAGHLKCEASPGPVFNRSSVSYAEAMLQGGVEDKYSWRSHSYTDAHVLQFFRDQEKRNNESQGRAQLGVIDMSPLYLRPDAHALGDCLHFCAPGPLDLFAQLMLASLAAGELG
jgi:hypothetical protein